MVSITASRSGAARILSLLALGGALLALGPSAAYAQGADAKAAAETLFSQGKKQLEAGQFAEACKSFSKSQELDPSVGTLLNLGRCNEKQGKIASAWAAYKEAAQLARERNDTDRAKLAEDSAAPLEPRLSTLTVTSKGNEPNLVVKRDGVQLSALDAPVPTDPGEHLIEASAPGFKPFKVTVTIAAESEKKSLEIPPLAPLPPGSPPIEEPPPGGESSGDSGMPLKIAGFVVGGVGLVGLGLGIGFGVMASSTASNAEDDPALCPEKRCSPAGREEIDSAETQATISTVGIAVGGVALAAGVVLVVVGFTQDSGGAPPSDAVRPAVFGVAGGPFDPSATLFGVEGSF